MPGNADWTISLDLEVLAELLIPYGLPFGQEGLDLFERQSVALDCGGMVGLGVSDVPPNVCRFQPIRVKS